MLLYLLRHGEAEPRAATDAARKLTSKGRNDVHSVARLFNRNELQFDRCISSPYTRTMQTAKAFLQELQCDLQVEENAILMPDKRAQGVMQMLEQLPPDAQVLLITHNPLVSELSALLVDGNIHNMSILATSELLAIEIDVIGLGMGRQVLRLAPGKLMQPD